MINEKMLSYVSDLVKREKSMAFDKVQYVFEVASSMDNVNVNQNKEIIDKLFTKLDKESEYDGSNINLSTIEKAYVFLYHMGFSYSIIVEEFKSLAESQRRRLYE
nr:hypothetical protein [uncultured Anaerosporobacter sp.]